MPFPLLGTIVECIIESDDTHVVLRFGTVADFLVTRTRITCVVQADASPDAVRWLLYGAVAGIWLELCGHCVLHGGVVTSGDEAVAFLGASGAGKSTLLAALSRFGRGVVADDHVVIDVHEGRLTARPGLPWMKVSPATARYLGLAPDRLTSLHPAVRKRAWPLPSIDRRNLPLRHVVVLERHHQGGAAPTELRQLPSREAFVALVKHAYSPQAVRVLGYQARRLPVLARLSGVQSVSRISYPSGFADLDRVALDVCRLTSWP